MSEFIKKTREFPLTILAGAGLFILPPAILLWKSGRNAAALPFILIAIIGIFLLRKINISNIKIKLSKQSFLYLLAVLLYAGLFLTDIIRYSQFSRPSEMALRLMLAIPIYFFALSFAIKKSNNINTLIKSLYAGFIIAAIGSLILASYQIYLGLDRAKGINNPVIFAHLCAVTTIVCSCALFRGGLKKYEKFLLGIAIFSAFTAVILSGTRGAWLALFLMGIMAYLMVILILPKILLLNNAPLEKVVRIKKRFYKIIFIIIITSISIAATLHFINIIDLKSRTALIYQEIKNYKENPEAATSTGARIVMWNLALDLIKEKPIIGWGEKGWQTEKEKRYLNSEVYSEIGQHAHNEILNIMAKYGIFAGVILILIYISPVMLAHKKRQILIKAGQTDIWLLLCFLPFIFFTLGLTDVPLFWVDGITFYIYIIALFCGIVDAFFENISTSSV